LTARYHRFLLGIEIFDWREEEAKGCSETIFFVRRYLPPALSLTFKRVKTDIIMTMVIIVFYYYAQVDYGYRIDIELA
jgi:hypothetical protein